MNSIKLRALALLLLGAHITLTGCSSEGPSTARETQESPIVGDFDQMNYFIGRPPSAPLGRMDMSDPANQASATATLREAMPLLQTSREILRSDESASAKHQGLQEILSETEELSADAAWFVTTSIAVRALHEFKSQDDVSPTTIEPYVVALIENKNPNADLIYSGLARLQTHWTEERVRDAATQASQAAAAHLAEECEACDQARKSRSPVAGEEGRSEKILAAIRALNDMSESRL